VEGSGAQWWSNEEEPYTMNQWKNEQEPIKRMEEE